MTNLYLRPESAPQPLPFSANDADGRLWTDLAGNEEGRIATGWNEPAPAKLVHDEATQQVVWYPELSDWVIETLPVLEPVEPQPRILGKLEFIGLVQAAGGMTDAQLTTAYKDPQLEAFWVKYQMASSVERDHPVTAQALSALDALGYVPNGAQAVLAAWPMQ